MRGASEMRARILEELRKIGAGEYAKNRTDMYHVLRPYMDRAITNTKRLDCRI